MMFAKTFCRPGSYLRAIPVGLQATLQYNAKGLLETVLSGYDTTNKKPLTKELFENIKKTKLVPSTISLTGGTTWVKGVFYTDSTIICEGKLSNNSEKVYSAELLQHPDNFQFYAGHVESLASSFNAVPVINNWLDTHHFNVIKGQLIPADMNETTFRDFLYRNHAFSKKAIAGYMLNTLTGYRYMHTDVHQHLVKSVKQKMNEFGEVLAELSCADTTITVPYSSAISFDINAQSLVTLTGNTVLQSEVSDGKKRDRRSDKLTCECCGNSYIAPKSGKVECTDPNCPSFLYSKIKLITNEFKLPEMPSTRFLELVKKKELTCILDLVDLPEYKNFKLETDLAGVLRATVPYDVCRFRNIFIMLTNKCNNSIDTFKYYLQNPNRLLQEVESANLAALGGLVRWLSEPQNLLTVESLLSIVTLVNKNNSKFEGAPIFRGKTIAITGTFNHGSLAEIVSILSSYSAEVAFDYNNQVSCLIIGDRNENNSGTLINDCRGAGIRIFSEKEFFDQYEIDDDLRANLL